MRLEDYTKFDIYVDLLLNILPEPVSFNNYTLVICNFGKKSLSIVPIVRYFNGEVSFLVV